MMKNIKPAIALRIATVFVVVLAMLAIGFTPPQAGAQRINKKAAAAKKAERVEKRKAAKGKKASQIFLIKLNNTKFGTVKKLLKTPKLPNGKAAQAFIKEYLGLKVLATLGKSSPDLKFTFIVRLPSNVKNESIQARLKRLKAQELLEFSADVVGTGTDALAPRDLPEDVQVNATMAFLGSRAKKAAGKDVAVRANAAPKGAGWVAVPLNSKNPSLLGAIVGLNKTWKKIKKGNPGNPQNGSVQISLATWEGLDKLGEGDTKNVLVWETLKTLLCAAQKDMVAIGAVGSKEKGYFPLPLVPVCAAKKLAKPEGVLGLSAGLVAKIGGEGKADSKREAGALNGYTVSGRVTTQAENNAAKEPVGGVTVEARLIDPADNSEILVQTAKTNRNGSYTIKSLTGGSTYKIYASKGGVNYNDDSLGGTPTNKFIEIQNIAQDTPAQNFNLVESGITISGTVRGLRGTDEAEVCLYKNQEEKGCAETAADGAYTISGVSRGRYKVRVKETTPSEKYNLRKANKSVRVRKKDRVVNLAVRALKVNVSGQVKRELNDGKFRGVGRVIVTATFDGGDSVRTRTNKRGNYRLKVIKLEKVTLSAEKKNIRFQAYIGDTACPNQQVCPLPNTQTEHVFTPDSAVNDKNFRDEEGDRTISGVVVGLAAEAGHIATVCYGDGANCKGDVEAKGQDGGKYEITGVKRGSYTVKVKSATPNGHYNIAAAKRAVTVAENNVTNVNLVVSAKTYTISGKVTKDGATPIGGVLVTAETSQGTVVKSTTTNAKGTYTLSGLAHGGDYTIRAVKAPHDFGNPKTYSQLSGNVSDCHFNSNVMWRITGVIAGLERSLQNSGQGDTDKVKITAQCKDNMGNPRPIEVVDNKGNGAYESAAEVPNGTCTITAAPVGQVPQGRYSIQPASYVRTVNNKDSTGVNFTFAWKKYTLTGKVGFTDGTGLGGALVTAKAQDAGDHPDRTYSTTAAGSFTLSNMKVGVNYKVTP
ncbi:MAG: hypothetical protein GX589_02030, partial [Deltaproteobacteria bacterium]|nr:hypothetical protein [Deltaproteobacteria bacterium]